MICGQCDKTDGMCYTSNPPQVKCAITEEFHFYDDECNTGFASTNLLEGAICTDCIVCGEEVPLIGITDNTKMCDKCKQTIMFMREIIKREKDEEIV